jgi:hypothetical protein
MPQQLLASFRGQPQHSLTTLAADTVFKLILTGDDNQLDLPYLNINTPYLENDFSITVAPNENRTALQAYIKALCADANKILICDNYFTANNNWSNT